MAHYVVLIVGVLSLGLVIKTLSPTYCVVYDFCFHGDYSPPLLFDFAIGCVPNQL